MSFADRSHPPSSTAASAPAVEVSTQSSMRDPLLHEQQRHARIWPASTAGEEDVGLGSEHGWGRLPESGEAYPERMQDPRGMAREDFSTPKTQKRKVVHRSLPSGQIKTEPELLRREVPLSSGKIQKPPKRSIKNEPRLPTPQSDRGTPDSLPDSGPADEYRALRRKYLLLEEENFTLDSQLGMAEEEVKTLEDEKFALLDQLVVLEGLVDPLLLQPQRRL